MSEKGIVNIHGKQYKTVALRTAEFRDSCPASDGWGITTTIIEMTDEKVVVLAQVMKTFDGFGYLVVGSGLAEESRGASKINRTSALENAETSAIGRALSSIGLGGEEYASADEVLRAIEQQEDWEPSPVVQPTITDELVKEEQEDIPDNIVDLVNQNCDKGIELMGTKAYMAWHTKILNNFWGVDTIDALEGDDAYARFYKLQNEKFKGMKNE